MSAYCRIAPGHPVHGPYHDTEYGFPSADETVLFERLCLEIMQAGLSWELVLKRREGMRAAFAGFAVDRVAAFGEADQARLLADPRIIRNRLKAAGHRRECAAGAGAAGEPWRICRLARCAPPAGQAGVGQAVQADISCSPAGKSSASSC